ncbi:metal-dependent transcriptional regulator [Acidobacteria bacterium AH-259-A15]|nr:metal-dependent transcriptional regulator [Acidobacteria bacterium AH-259-A15]
MVSQATEDYLKIIYKLQRQRQQVKTSDIALARQVTPASVTNMVKKLARMRLLVYTSYRGVELMPGGEKIALRVIRLHRLLELYLKEALGYSWDRVHEEAEKLEHHISEEFEERIFEALGRPAFDPHGDPIPTKEGEVHEANFTPLSDAESGDLGTICRVDDGNPELLRYLAKIGLVPNVTVEVLERAPFNGPLTVKVGDFEHMVGRDVAADIYVASMETADS